MWRFALLCSVVTLTVAVACTDGPGAPSTSTDGPSLQRRGDPPPPPLDGAGDVNLAPASDFAAAADVGAQQEPPDCVPPAFFIPIDVRYSQNKSQNHAMIHFTPVEGSGSGTIHEKANQSSAPPFDQKASGTLVVVGTDGQKHQVHVREYAGTSLFFFEPGDFIGFTSGALVAEVTACGEPTTYTGTLSAAWCDDCGKF